MKFGLSYNTAFAGTDPANLKAIARHADDLGFELFYVKAGPVGCRRMTTAQEPFEEMHGPLLSRVP